MIPFTPPPLFGKHPRPFVDPFAPVPAVQPGMPGWLRWAAEFPDWCRPVPGQEQPWFMVDGVLYWGSARDGSCRAWTDPLKSVIAASAPTWRLLKWCLAGRHGVPADRIEVRPNLPAWVKQ